MGRAALGRMGRDGLPKEVAWKQMWQSGQGKLARDPLGRPLGVRAEGSGVR